MNIKSKLITIKNYLLGIKEQKDIIIYDVQKVDIVDNKEKLLKKSIFENPEVIRELIWSDDSRENIVNKKFGVGRLYSDFGETYYDSLSGATMQLFRISNKAGCMFESRDDNGNVVIKFNINGNPVSYEEFHALFKGKMKEIFLDSTK